MIHVESFLKQYAIEGDIHARERAGGKLACDRRPHISQFSYVCERAACESRAAKTLMCSYGNRNHRLDSYVLLWLVPKPLSSLSAADGGDYEAVRTKKRVTTIIHISRN